MTKSESHPAVGIDLGTTYSAVAFLDSSGRPETIRNSEGGLTTPSAVFFDHDRPIVGIEAIEAGLQEPDRLALYAKRDMGEDRYEKTIRGETLPPELLQALVLRKLKADAELKLGPIDKAVVTVPAFFNEPCRKATQDAGALAGLRVLDIINEPTAAAITYGVEQGFLSQQGESEKRERVLVYDLGGGTFDVTLMEIDGRKYTTIATAGDVYLGGIDWDRRIVDFIAEKFVQQHDVDPRQDPCGEQELLRKANQAKHALTQRDTISIAMAHDGNRLRTELSQEEFSRLTEDLVERTLMTTRMVLDDADTRWSDVTRLILVGGSTRMPMIRDELSRLSGMQLDRSLSPDEAVSHGAAIYAGILLGHGADSFAGVSVSNVNSHDLGVLAIDPATGDPRRQVMIPRNSKLPARKRVRFRTHADNQKNVKVQVVEGGDQRGTNATKIGKFLVDDLPAETPKGTSVDVQFDYAQDGRLTVSAQLPSIDCQATLTLNRAAGLSDEMLKKWRGRIQSGLGDPEPSESSEAEPETSSDSGQFALESPPPPVDLPPVAPPPQKEPAAVSDPKAPAAAKAPAEQVTPSPSTIRQPAKKKLRKSKPKKLDLSNVAPAKPVTDPGKLDPALADFLSSTDKPATEDLSIDLTAGEPESGARKKLKRVKKAPESTAAAPKKLRKKKKAEPAADSDNTGDWKSRRTKLSSSDGNEEA